MQPLRPYHFAQLREAAFQPYYAAILGAGGIACFDWEDSIQVLGDEAATLALKHAQRQQVRQVLAHPGIAGEGLAVRLNAPGTAHYAADLRALHGLRALHAVFVPKAEHPDALRHVLRELPVPVRHVIPIVETAAGFDALPALLAVPDVRLSLVAFGHCDYNLSKGLFPFQHQDSAQYWAWVAELDGHLQAAGKHLLNSPVLRLDDEAYFRAALHRLRAYPSAAGQITLCLRQTLACATAASAVDFTPAAGPDCAPQLAQSFEQHRQPGRFFALDAHRRLISPHEYVAAHQAPPNQLCT
jgi:hypothetical protein